MARVHQRIVIGVVDNIEIKSMDAWLSEEHPKISIMSLGPDSPSVLFSTLHPEDFLDGTRYIIHCDGSARTVIALPKQTTFRVKQNLKSPFLNYLKSLKAKKEDIDLVVFVLASGTEDGQIKIGSKKMGKDELEKALRKFPGKMTLIVIGFDGRPWKSEKWDTVTLERSSKHDNFPFFESACSNEEFCGASHSLPLNGATTDWFNDLDDMDMSVRDYPCSQIGLFDPLTSVSSSEKFPFPPYLKLHRKSGSTVELNPSKTNAKFTSPERLSVETIDGFLATSYRLGTTAPTIYFAGFIARGAEDLQIFPEAEKALRFRSTKRNQTRRFVALMGWAVDEEDEEAGIGFSDLAMDTTGPMSLCEVEINEALGSDIFPRSVGPCTHVGVHHSIRYRQPQWWAARHWERAGKPAINPNHFLYTMKRAGLLPNDDAVLIARTESPFTICDMEVL